MNIQFRFVALLICLMLSSCSHVKKANMAAWGNPYEADPAFLALGKKTYEQTCTRCHGGSGIGDGPELTSDMAPPPNFVDGSFDKSIGMTAANITYGKRKDMPAFQKLISDKEIWAVAHYVLSLKE